MGLKWFLLASLLLLATQAEENDMYCSVESVEYANSNQLSSILEELLNTTYFRMFRVDMHKECTLGLSKTPQTKKPSPPPPPPSPSSFPLPTNNMPFSPPGLDPMDMGMDQNEGQCTGPMLTFDDGPAKSSCSLDKEEQQPTFSDFNGNKEGTVDNSISTKEGEMLMELEAGLDCEDEDEHSPTFWLNLCDRDDGKGEYINLQLNPERNTGYNGTKLWKAIYEENCFIRTGTLHDLCYEERVLYRLLSGMHTSIDIHISLAYFFQKNGVWTPNPQRFIDHYGDKPQFLKNLHFSFVVLLRSLHRAAPHLANFTFNSGDVEEDKYTGMLFKRLLEAPVLKSCDEVFSAFDESLLFKEDTDDKKDTRSWNRGVTMDGRLISLKRQFKYVFRNISSILDCVPCQICKLHAKVQLLGIGTALKILLTPEGNLQHIHTWMTREEFVALINTIGRWSNAIKGINDLSEQYRKSIESMQPLTNTKIGEVKSGPEDTGYAIPVAPTESDLLGYTDLAMRMVLDLFNQQVIQEAEEEALITRILSRDTNVLLLAKNFHKFPQKFLKYALLNENVQKGSILTINSRKDQYDAVVIGGGLAGLTTALTLLDRGARVALVEKEAFFGGNSAWASSGINAVDDIDLNVDGDSVNLYIQDMTKASGSANELEMATVLAGNSGPALKWIRERLGVKLEQVGQLGGHSKPRTHRPTTGLAGAELIVALERALKKGWESQLTILKNTRVSQLITEGEKVTGIKYSTKAKKGDSFEEGELYAPNVVLATGGFAADYSEDSLLKKYTPSLLRYPTTNGGWASGDGHKLATRDARASLVDMHKVQVHPTAFVDSQNPNSQSKTLCAEILRGVGGILLDKNGQRFCNELGNRAYVFGKMNETATKLGGTEDDLQFTILLNAESSEKAKSTHIPLYERKKLLTKFDKFSDLAEKLGVDKKDLEETLGKYNQDAVKGNDEFGKTKFNSVPFTPDTVPYYAGTVTPALHYCMGGIAIDSSGKVKREDGSTIQGLFAAGEVTGGIHGDTRLGGNALTECVVFGRLVGSSIELSKKEREALPVTEQEAKREKKSEVVSKEELEAHNQDGDCWVAIDGKVYDLSDFASEHPGGAHAVLQLAGKDGTKEYKEVHTMDMLEGFTIVGEYSG
eukprot:TRINITY_DN5414_c0_g4_i1.p1 TRINITY_DN5414_c0_g4~~TRINITY_DN5414_c0_g4_i1.p1  ORF type:complete len:1142 (-),score=252.37 TRINITY_DN5414_c0_g4_i1:82-3507(-)